MKRCALDDYQNGLCLTKGRNETIATPCIKQGCPQWRPDLPARLRKLAEEMKSIVSEISRKDPDGNFMQMAMFAKEIAVELEKEE